ncbi:hypothetical protein SNE40_009260 [Patella caerulea]|uniref:Uncharacterized protein n=1 Tax=Patella caerulea TaxID=87958 RepID=A0AAN8PRM7_PATCE
MDTGINAIMANHTNGDNKALCNRNSEDTERTERKYSVKQKVKEYMKNLEVLNSKKYSQSNSKLLRIQSYPHGKISKLSDQKERVNGVNHSSKETNQRLSTNLDRNQPKSNLYCKLRKFESNPELAQIKSKERLDNGKETCVMDEHVHHGYSTNVLVEKDIFGNDSVKGKKSYLTNWLKSLESEQMKKSNYDSSVKKEECLRSPVQLNIESSSQSKLTVDLNSELLTNERTVPVKICVPVTTASGARSAIITIELIDDNTDPYPVFNDEGGDHFPKDKCHRSLSLQSSADSKFPSDSGIDVLSNTSEFFPEDSTSGHLLAPLHFLDIPSRRWSSGSNKLPSNERVDFTSIKSAPSSPQHKSKGSWYKSTNTHSSKEEIQIKVLNTPSVVISDHSLQTELNSKQTSKLCSSLQSDQDPGLYDEIESTIPSSVDNKTPQFYKTNSIDLLSVDYDTALTKSVSTSSNLFWINNTIREVSQLNIYI